MNYLAGFLVEGDRFLVLMARLAGISFIPLFNTRNIPLQWRVFFLLALTFFAWFLGLANTFTVNLQLPAYSLVIITELLTGIAMALVIQFFFAGVQLAGQLIDTQMGFGIMNVVDPLVGTQTPLLGNFKFILAILLFLQIDGHHYFIKALFDSYELVPIGSCVFLDSYFIENYLSYFGKLFIVGCKFSIPIVGTLLVTDFVMGIMARTVPQMNIFMVGMPIKILIGFFVLLITIPFYIYILNLSFCDLFQQIYNLFR